MYDKQNWSSPGETINIYVAISAKHIIYAAEIVVEWLSAVPSEVVPKYIIQQMLILFLNNGWFCNRDSPAS